MGSVDEQKREDGVLGVLHDGGGGDIAGREGLQVERLTQHKRKYPDTEEGFLKRRWACMRNRVSSKARENRNYRGKELLLFGDFMTWARCETFHKMYKDWVESGRRLGMTPTVDRIDNDKGYVEGNLQWLTQKDNLRKGGVVMPGVSGFFGVQAIPGNRFQANIFYGGKRIAIGCFGSAEQAAKERDKWAKRLQGKYARLNFKD